MDLLEIFFALDVYGRASFRWFILFEAAGRSQVAKFALYQFKNFFVWHISGGGYQQMIRREPFAEAGLQRFTRELPNSVGSAQNRPAQGMLRPEAAGENFVQQRFRIVEIHLDLFENYLTFFCHVVGIEERTKTQV